MSAASVARKVRGLLRLADPDSGETEAERTTAKALAAKLMIERDVVSEVEAVSAVTVSSSGWSVSFSWGLA